MNHASVAAKVRAAKEKWPLRYCADTKCLWNLSHGPCPKHGGAVSTTKNPPPAGQYWHPEFREVPVVEQWKRMLQLQRATRVALDTLQAQEREAFYRKHKPVMDSLTPEDRK